MNQVIVPPTPSDGRAPTSSASSADTALAAVRDVTSEIVRLVRSTATQATDGWSLATVMRTLVPELERVFEERAALEAEVQALRARNAEAAELRSILATREAGWSAERTTLEHDLAYEREQGEMLQRDCEQRRGELQVLQGRERRLREQMEGIAARANADREETLRLAREMVQSAEEARFAVVEEMETLRAALAADQARLVEVQHERVRASQSEAQTEAELARARQMIEQLEASRASTAAELARVRGSLVHVESELLAGQHEYQLAQVQIEKLCGAQDDMVEDRAQLVAKLHAAKEREARLRLRITGLDQRMQTGAGITTPASAPEAVEIPADDATSALAVELSRAEKRTRALEAELAKARAATSAVTIRVDELQAAARHGDVARLAAIAEAEVLRATVEALERQRLEATAAARVATEHSTAAIAGAVEPGAPDEPMDEAADVEIPTANAGDGLRADVVELSPIVEVSIDEPVPAFELSARTDELETVQLVEAGAAEVEPMVASVPELVAPDEAELATAPEPEAAPSAAMEEIDGEAIASEQVGAPATAGTIAILDVEDGWDLPNGIEGRCVAPGPEAWERVRDLAATACLVNLAAPGALETVVALRAAKDPTPLRACAIAPGGIHGYPLGPFDVVTRPVDPERVRTQLADLAPAGATVVMVGSESATLMPLRQGLLQAGMSVRTAWTRQQAMDLTEAAPPDVVIVDLASETAEGAALILDLLRREKAPCIVVVSAPTPRLDELATALAAHAVSCSVTERTELVRAAAAPQPVVSASHSTSGRA